MMQEPDGSWRIGELAEATGLSVRALHHYEAMNLVMPIGRTSGGHRLYGPAAVERLYQVVMLRALGLPLEKIRTIIDAESPQLRSTLSQHLEVISARTREQTRLRDRLATVVARLEEEPTNRDIVSLIQDVVPLHPEIDRNISILIYADLAQAYEYLAAVYQFVPGTVTRDSEDVIQHAVLHAGHNEFWLHPESQTFNLASPQTLGGSTATTAVLVDDVDAHYQHAAATGADIRYEPIDQPYGFREYSVVDLEGHLWSFIQPVK